MEFKIRTPKIEDARDFWHMRTSTGVFENMLGLESDTLAASQKYLENLPGSGNYIFVAVVTENGRERAVGSASMHPAANPRLSHSASVGIMVDKDFQGKGIGRALMLKMLDLADNWLMLTRLELGVYSVNERAHKFYMEMGFEDEGVKKYAAKRGGAYVDEIIMARINKKLLPEDQR